MTEKLFGTDGIRGAAGEFPLDAPTVETIGASFARQMNEKLGRAARLVVGRDTRESGARIERAFCKGASANEAHCESAEIITTPGVAYLTEKFAFDAGIVVSASHNPFGDNGIKIFTPSGRKIDEAIEREIERDVFESSKFNVQSSKSDVQDAEFAAPESSFAVDASNASAMRNDYLDYLAGEFKSLRLDNLKLVLDCANGAACALAPKLFERFGANVLAINDAPDGRNINENCGSLHLENLREKVLAESADFGAAFDGDADRALFVDEKGNLIDGDATLWIMARHLQAQGKLNDSTVVATVMSNIGLEIALASENIRLVRAAVGDKYVLQELLKTGASVGGEQSGHIIFPARSLVGDGLMTTLALLEAARANEKSLSELTHGFTPLPQILVNVRVGKKTPFESVPQITGAASAVENKLGANGRLLLRYSGTENLARVMIEGENQAEIERLANDLAAVIKTSLS
jgi:phosphoglucosamine mutase